MGNSRLRSALLLCGPVLFCLAVPAEPAGPVNRVPNGGFEGPDLSPWRVFGEKGKRPDVHLSQQSPKEGKQAVRFHNNQRGYGGLQIDLKGMEGISAPLFIRASANRARSGESRPAYTFGISFNARYADDSAKWVSPAAGFFNPANTGWQSLEFVWTPPKPLKSFQLRLMFIHEGECLFDGVQVRPATRDEIARSKLASHRPRTPPKPAPVVKLRALSNGRFEEPALSRWGPFGKPRPSVELEKKLSAFEGAQCLKVSFEKAGFGGAQSATFLVEQKEPVPFLIEAAGRRDRPGKASRAYTFGISMQLRFMDGQKKWEAPPKGNFDPQATGWQKVSFLWLPPKPVQSIGVRLMTNEAGPAWFDAVRILELKESLLDRDDIQLGDIRPVGKTETFSKGRLPSFLFPHIGEWKASNGVLQTAGQVPPPGWYLRSRYEYKLDQLSLKLRKKKPGGIVFLHTRHWRFLLRARELMVKSVAQPDWWASCHRNIRFDDTGWHRLRVSFRKDRMSFAWDGQELKDWLGPANEWQGKPYAHWLKERTLRFVNVDEILVLHPYQTEAEFDDLLLKGVQTGPAQGFIQTLRYPGRFIRDNQFERMAPIDPVDVNWHFPAAAKPKKLPPPVSQWRIDKFLPDRQPKGVHFLEYTIGGADNSGFPAGVYHPKYDAPVEARVLFNLTKGGVYTLEVPIAAIKNLANVLEIDVDGQTVSREVYRGFNSSTAGPGEGLKDYVPLKLRPGLHQVVLRYSPQLLDKFDNRPSMPPPGKWEYQSGWFWKFGRIVFGLPLELVPGLSRPTWTISAKQPQPPEALSSPPQDTDLFGKELNFVLKDLPNGPAELRLGFQEFVLDSPGQRLMDIFINDRKVAADFDIVKEAGNDLTWFECEFPFTIENGAAHLRLLGKNFQATVSYLEVRKERTAVLRYNAGYTPRFNNWAFHARVSENKARQDIYCDPERNHLEETSYFEGHNLAANPSFTFEEEDGRPVGWRSAAELKSRAFSFSFADYKVHELAGTGIYSRDTDTFRTPPAALRIGRTRGAFGMTTAFATINYTKQQAFSVWARADRAAGRARIALYFYAQDYFDRQLAGLPLRFLGKAVSENFLTGSTGWRQLQVSAKPPFGAAFVAMVIQVKNNSAGTFWFDDARMDGYGAEPLEITRSHLGFHPAGNKRFLVKSMSRQPVRFKVTNSEGRTVNEGQARPLGYRLFPGRFYFGIGVDQLVKEGEFGLEVIQGSEHRACSFTVSSGVYRNLTRLLMTAIDAKRMNVEVPGYHEPTHLDDYAIWEMVFPRFDRQVKVYPKTRDSLGGFHDAGDRIKHWDLMPGLSFGAMMAQAAFAHTAPDLSRWGARLARVGLDSQARAQLPDGNFFYADKPYRYDSIPKYGIERYIRSRVKGPQTAGLFAREALRIQKTDPARSKTYQAAAEKVFQATRIGWDNLSAGLERIQFNRLRYDTKQIFGALYLGLLTGESLYRKSLDEHLHSYCDAMEARAYLEPGYRAYGEVGGFASGIILNLDLLWAPSFFLEEMPDHPLAGRVRKALLLFAQDIERLSAIEPWGQAMALSKPGQRPARWPAQRPLNYWTMLSLGLARAGMLCDRPELVRLAERQLQWCLGHNPYDIAMVHGVGDQFVAGGDMFYLEPEFHRRHLASGRKLWYYDGNVPTMAFRINRRTSLRYGDGSWGPISGSPVGYAPMFLQPDYPIDPGPTEYWQAHSGPFCAAAAVMAQAMDWLKKRR